MIIVVLYKKLVKICTITWSQECRRWVRVRANLSCGTRLHSAMSQWHNHSKVLHQRSRRPATKHRVPHRGALWCTPLQNRWWTLGCIHPVETIVFLRVSKLEKYSKQGHLPPVWVSFCHWQASQACVSSVHTHGEKDYTPLMDHLLVEK